MEPEWVEWVVGISMDTRPDRLEGEIDTIG